MILIALLAVTTLFTGCHESTPATGDAAASQTRAAARPELHAADFDPKPDTPPMPKVSGERAFQMLKEFVALGPRYLGSEGHARAERYILNHLRDVAIEQDRFNEKTAAGPFPVANIIAKFPGKKDGIIVLAGHYDTNLPLKNTNFIGANDGGSDVGLLLEIASQLRTHPPEGYSIWLLFTDAEEATITWTNADSVYGSKHLAKRWASDGTAAKIKAFLLLDMIGDKDLHFEEDTNSTPWLAEVVRRSGQRLGYQDHFSTLENPIKDDHIPFRDVGIPVADIIDLDYGFDNLYHHTTQDTPDKCSPVSLQITGDIVMETIRALNTR